MPKTEDVGNLVDDFGKRAAGKAADDYTYHNTQEEGFAQQAEFLFHAFGVDFELVHAGDGVKTLVDGPCKGYETCAEGLRD